MSTIISRLNDATDGAVARIEELEEANAELRDSLEDSDRKVEEKQDIINDLEETISGLREQLEIYKEIAERNYETS